MEMYEVGVNSNSAPNSLGLVPLPIRIRLDLGAAKAKAKSEIRNSHK